MVPMVLAESVASEAVALTVLPARLGCTSVTAGVWPKKSSEGADGALLGVGVISRNVHRYSSSACVNLCVVATNGLSPETGQGSGEWTKVAGAIGGLATGQGSLNMEGACRCDGVR